MGFVNEDNRLQLLADMINRNERKRMKRGLRVDFYYCATHGRQPLRTYAGSNEPYCIACYAERWDAERNRMATLPQFERTIFPWQ